MASYLHKATGAVKHALPSHKDADTDTGELPPSATVEREEKPIDEIGLTVFQDKNVKHEVLVKLNQLKLDDAKHGLGEVRELFDEGEEGIQFYKPISYMIISVPHGEDFIGKILLDNEGHCIHVRVFSPPGGTGPYKFHSIDTRPTEDGGALFKQSDKLKYFEY
ncbi:hypothetical protein BDY24DRAFT_378688 [Mrakia frigida]|uniref:uncharacterized protein n=1 Tax=Mrakia frigida TaxID=29902 RepID=UPI003FCC0F21